MACDVFVARRRHWTKRQWCRMNHSASASFTHFDRFTMFCRQNESNEVDPRPNGTTVAQVLSQATKFTHVIFPRKNTSSSKQNLFFFYQKNSFWIVPWPRFVVPVAFCVWFAITERISAYVWTILCSFKENGRRPIIMFIIKHMNVFIRASISTSIHPAKLRRVIYT